MGRTVWLLGWLVLGLASAAGAAEPWPARPVRIVVGFAAGGVADLSVRVVAQRLSPRLGQPVVVDNRPSAGGVIAAETVATAPADGHTLLLVSNGTAVTQSLFRNLSYDARTDFAPVSLIGRFDIVLVARADAPFRSVADLIAAARERPGQVSIGTINPGSTQHLAAALFRSMAGIDVTLVPFRGTPAVIGALRGNEIQVGFDMLAALRPQIEAGALRPLAVSSDRRFARLPAVPTVQESGLPGYAVASWNGIAAPARTPAVIIERLHDEIGQVLAMTEVRQALLDLGIEPRGSTPAELGQLMTDEIARWAAVIREAGIEPQ